MAGRTKDTTDRYTKYDSSCHMVFYVTMVTFEMTFCYELSEQNIVVDDG